jgi:hypothetical protein
VIFKFIENDFEKLQRLIEFHQKLFEQVAEFDLTKFDSAEDVQYLIDDYRFETLELVDFLLAFLSTSQAAATLS